MMRALLVVLLLGAPGADLVPIPRPDLAAVEEGVRRQLETERATVDELLAGAADPARLAEAVGGLGRLYHAYDLEGPAAACYENAHRLDPSDFRWAYLRGFLERMDGELDAARESFEEALRLRPGDRAARLHLAFVELDGRRFERAEAVARKVLERDAESAAAHYVLGRAARGRGDLVRAIEHFDRVLELQPAARRVHYPLAQLHRRLGDEEAARRHLEQLGSTDVGFPDPLVESLRRAPAGAAAHMQHGAQARAAGRLGESVAAYRRAVALDPENVSARRDLALVLSEAGDAEGAIEQYRAAAELEPESALTHFSFGLLLKDLGRAEESVVPLRRAVELEPEHRDFRFVLAGQLAAAGDLSGAAGHYRHVLERSPRDAESRLHLALAEAGLGDLAAARGHGLAVLELDAPPWTTARAHHLLATIRLHEGDRDEAVAHLRRALEAQPSFSEAHFALANLLGQAGRFDEAAEHYRRALAVEPERVAARLGEATALTLGGRQREAVERLEEGREVLPAEPALTHALARLLASATDPGVRDGERALALASELFRARRTLKYGETLALALAEVGRRAEAADLLRTLIAELPSDVDPEVVAGLRRSLEIYERSAGD